MSGKGRAKAAKGAKRKEPQADRKDHAKARKLGEKAETVWGKMTKHA